MTLLRAIRDDLVEKKLWPVAVALLLALVAIPVLLARGGSDVPEPVLPDPAATAPPVTADPATTKEPVVLAEAATVKVRPTGRFKDPFRNAGKDEAAGTAASDGTAVKVDTQDAPLATLQKTGGDVPAPVGVGTSAPAAVSSEPVEEPVAPSVPAVDTDTYDAGYRVDLSWGPAADPRAVRDPARLTALEAGDEPQVVFMGVRPDGKTALFLLTGEVTGSGDARCRPTPEYCSLLEMKAGDTQFLDIVTEDGVRQYELFVDKVAERDAATAEAAEDRLDRVSKAGRKLVKETIEGGKTFARRYVYASKSGVVKFVAPDEDRAATRGLLTPAE